jgi:hypothetical protein
VEIILKYFFFEGIKGLSEWDEFFFEVEYVLNILINAITGYIPFFLLYGVYLRSEINSVPVFYNNIEQFF